MPATRGARPLRLSSSPRTSGPRVAEFSTIPRCNFLCFLPAGAAPLRQLPLHSGLGPALRIHRKSTRRITQGELARRTGLSVPTVRLLESGRGNLDSWRAVLASLGLELFGR